MIDARPDILDSARVGDCMRAGIFTCDPHTPLREVAATMSSLRIRAIALRAPRGHRPPFITDIEVMAGIALSGEASGHPVGVLSTTDILQAYAPTDKE